MNQHQTGMRLKKGDTVVIRLGTNKGRTGKILATIPKSNAVLIDGIGMVKRHIRPSQLNPRGGTKDIHVPVPASKVALVVDSQGTSSRVGYKITKAGSKVRVARKLNNKEIK